MNEIYTYDFTIIPSSLQQRNLLAFSSLTIIIKISIFFLNMALDQRIVNFFYEEPDS